MWQSVTENHLHQKCQIQDYQNKDRLPVCRRHLLQRKPKLGRRKLSTGPHAGCRLDIAGINSHRRGCWELQEELFAFAYDLPLHAWTFSTGSSARIWSVFCNGPTKQEWKSALKILRHCVSPDAQGSVFCKWAEIHCSRCRRSNTLEWYSRVVEVRTKILIHGLVKQTQFCLSFVALWSQTGDSKTAKLSVFKSVFVPMLVYGHEF